MKRLYLLLTAFFAYIAGWFTRKKMTEGQRGGSPEVGRSIEDVDKRAEKKVAEALSGTLHDVIRRANERHCRDKERDL